MNKDNVRKVDVCSCGKLAKHHLYGQAWLCNDCYRILNKSTSMVRPLIKKKVDKHAH